MAKKPETTGTEQPTEASRTAALEEFAQGAAAFMQDVGARLSALEDAAKDNAHVSRATAENAPIDGDVFARIKRLEQHAGIKS